MTALNNLLAINRVAAPHGCNLNPAMGTAIEQHVSGAGREIADLCDMDKTDVTSTPIKFAEEAHDAES